jgi:hypothetical protein
VAIGVHIFQLQASFLGVLHDKQQNQVTWGVREGSETWIFTCYSVQIMFQDTLHSSCVTGESTTKKSNIYWVPVMSTELDWAKFYLLQILVAARARRDFEIVFNMSLFYQWGNWGSWRKSDLPKVIQLGGEPGLKKKIGLLQCLFQTYGVWHIVGLHYLWKWIICSLCFWETVWLGY